MRLLWTFAATEVALLVASAALQPGWIRRFVQAAREYQRYAADTPTLQVLLTRPGGRIAELVLIFFALVMFWRWRRSSAVSQPFVWAIALAVSATLVVINKTAPYNSVLLIPALLALAVYHRAGGLWARAVIKAAFACQFWQWIAALALSIASLTIRPAWPLRVIQLPLYTVYGLPPLVLLAVLLSLPKTLPVTKVIPPAPVE